VLKKINKTDIFVCITLALFGIIWLHSIHIRSWRFDDSFFGYTYARNLVEGNGFTFNGVKVLGTSAPLPVLMYAGIAKLIGTDNIVLVAEHISIFSMILSSILLYFFVSGITNLKLAGFFSAMAYFFNMFIFMTFGHETILAILLILISLFLNLKKKFVLSYLILGLSFLCRAESIFVIVYMGIQTLADKPLKKENLRIYLYSVISFIAPSLAWFSFSYLYFRQLFSNSFKFKIIQNVINPGHFLPELVGFTKICYASDNIQIIALCVVAGVLAIGLLNVFKSKIYFMLFLSLGVIPIIFYCAINITYYHWFIFLFALMLTMFIGVSLKVVFGLYAGEEIQTKGFKYLLCVILLTVFFYSNYRFMKEKASTQENMTSYQVVGEYLAENTPPNASVGYVEVGQIAYYSHRKIIDLTGMVTKGVIDHLKAKDFNWTYDEYKPDYILDNPSFAWLYDFSKDAIKSNYTLVHTFEPHFNPCYYLYLYKRNN